MKIIEKKILTEYFEAICAEKKTFELRADVDNLRVGDVLRLKEWHYTKKYTGREVDCEITYILRNVSEYGLMSGYCICSLKLINKREKKYEESNKNVNKSTYEKT